MTSQPRADELPEGEAHLWYTFVHTPEGEALAEAAWGWMSPEERARHDRYHFEKNRKEYRATRALARLSLARYLGASPDALRFDATAHGKPFLVSHETDLNFNLSNTDGLVVCLLARRYPLGVDVEPLDRQVDARGVADRFFAPTEVRDLLALPEARHQRRFLGYWTLKEAYIKACGLGLAIPLDHFAYEVDGEERVCGIQFVPEREDRPEVWQFDQFELGERHLVGLAIRRGEDQNARVLLRKATLTRS